MKTYTLIFACFVAVLLSSCATRSYTQKYSASAGRNEGYDGRRSSYGAFEKVQDKEMMLDTVGSAQKITYTSAISLEVKNTDTALVQISRLAKATGGYVQSTGGDYAVIKIPSKGMNDAIEAIGALGKITDKNIYAEDITDAYYDAATRLDNLDKTRLRYLELLSKAQTVEEMLKVEKELERVNGEMEILKGRLARMDNSVQYSTITVSMYKKIKPGILGYPFVWAYKGIGWLFVRK